MKRIILKLSGEALSNYQKNTLYDESYIEDIFEEFVELSKKGIELAIVVGGGNIWRGRDDGYDIRRESSDQIGMLATCMNAIFVKEIFAKMGQKAKVFTPFELASYTKVYNFDDVDESLKNLEISIFAGGTGHPFFSTDTITALRAIQIEADGIFFLKSGIDALCEKDPKLAKENEKVKMFSILSAKTAIEDDNIKAIDETAIYMLRDNEKDFYLTGSSKGLVSEIINGKKLGTLITYEDRESVFYA